MNENKENLASAKPCEGGSLRCTYTEKYTKAKYTASCGNAFVTNLPLA